MTATEPITSANLIDIRDVIARVEHLEPLRQPGPVDLGPDDNAMAQDDLFAELAALETLLSNLKGYGGGEQWRGDWYPITLIRDDYFEDYARELAEDIGANDRNAPWPCQYIDWEAAADQLKGDYSMVEFEGDSYWYR